MFIGTVAIPRLDRREDRLEPLRTIRHEEAHSVARPPAQLREYLREAAKAVGCLSEHHHATSVDPGRAALRRSDHPGSELRQRRIRRV